MECGLAMDLLASYLDDELTEEAAQQVQAHLIGCRRCAWEAESIRQAAAALWQSAASDTPGEQFREGLLEEVLREHRLAGARRASRPVPLWQREPRRVYVLSEDGSASGTMGGER
jgi:anti-sigma factor RsiW